MSGRLEAFFSRLGVVQEEASSVDPRQLIADVGLAAAAAALQPTFERRAERAGVELGELRDHVAELVEQPVMITLGRSVASGDVHAEITMLATSCGMQFFLAGALWEQERHLPDVGDEASS